MNNLSKNPAFMKRMENAVEFNSNDSAETKTNYWLLAAQILAALGGAYCLYKLTEPRKIFIYHYHQPFTENKNPNQDNVD